MKLRPCLAAAVLAAFAASTFATPRQVTLAVPTMERWFTDVFKPRNPARWQEIHDTIVGTTPASIATRRFSKPIARRRRASQAICAKWA